MKTSFFNSWFVGRNDFGVEIGIRVILFFIFIISDSAVPFKRQIQPEEVWLYRFPHNEDTVSIETVHLLNIIAAIFIIFGVYKLNKNWNSLVDASLGVSMSILLSITIANFIKITVGRPRPDFFERCFGKEFPTTNNEVLALAACTGDEADVLQGYKSFPSGHSTLAFSGMAYLSFYLARSLKLFQPLSQQENQSLRMLAFWTPLVVATLIAASRTCDYHHHWQDVTVGSLLGIFVSYICYRQSFPSCLARDDKEQVSMHLSSPPIRETLTGVQAF